MITPLEIEPLDAPSNSTQNVDTSYISESAWSEERPKTMVVCCSDGRLQVSIDEFLRKSLGIIYYDRLYTPGGPGALSNIGSESKRAHYYRSDLHFLLEAHSFGQIILIFHGATQDGPADSVCAHYRRLMPEASYNEIVLRHHGDMLDVVSYLHELSPSLEILVFRAEVNGEKHVRFVDLATFTTAEK